jgi:hypothetical protein
MWYAIGLFALMCCLLAVVMYLTPPGEDEPEDEDDAIVDDLRLSLIQWPQPSSGYGDLDSEPQR